MALSERKKDVNKTSEWPNALPIQLERIVISYLFNPLHIFEDVYTFNQNLDFLMQPFVKAADRIKPLLGNTIFSKISNIDDKKHDSEQAVQSTYCPNILFDKCINKINKFSAESQIDFLIAVYNKNWEREEKNNVLRLTMKEIRGIYHDISFCLGEKNYVLDDLNEHILHVIVMKLSDYICSAYQNSAVSLINDNKKSPTENHIENIEKFLQQEEMSVLSSLRYSTEWGKKVNYITGIMIFFTGIIGMINSEGSYKSVVIGLTVLSMILLGLSKSLEIAALQSQKNAGFLTNTKRTLAQLLNESVMHSKLLKSEVVLSSDDELDEDHERNEKPILVRSTAQQH